MRLYLVNVDTEVTELLVLAGDCLTVETPCLARENSLGWGLCHTSHESQISDHLEYFIDPGYRVLCCVRVWCLGLGEVHTWTRAAAQLSHNNFVDVVDEEN